MFKKQALAFLAALTLVSGAQALGLGDIELNSNLNEPLDARIELLEPSDLSANEILPTLASRLAFEQAGVERDFFLSNIRFDVQPAANGGLVIQLSTSQAVREPFLNFLVEVNWPGGRLLKEYTLLLDPPLFDTEAEDQTRSVEPAATASQPQSAAPATPQRRVNIRCSAMIRCGKLRCVSRPVPAICRSRSCWRFRISTRTPLLTTTSTASRQAKY